MEHHKAAGGLAGAQFTVKTAFTNEDLQRIYASGSNIVVAKPVGGDSPNVAWVVYRPLPANSIQWEENYGIYASNVEIQNGALLTQIAQTPFPAEISKLYTMTPAGTIMGPGPGGAPGTYRITNEYDNPPKRYLTFGLFQAAVVNGRQESNAVSAATVLYKSTATMTTFTTVFLWVQSQVRSNTVVTDVTSPMTKVTLSSTAPVAALKYDSDTGRFIPAPGAKILEGGGGVEHIFPSL